jgi:Ni,Fe-hydrogenase maturation factor
VAAAIARRARPGVRATVTAQLTPELAESVAAARLVVFVDATRAPAGARVRARRLAPAPAARALGHVGSPEGLLALAQALFGARPRAWLVTVPGTDFAVGEGLSPRAQAGLAAALRTIATLVRRAARIRG